MLLNCAVDACVALRVPYMEVVGISAQAGETRRLNNGRLPRII
jgi:hypothetical protein